MLRSNDGPPIFNHPGPWAHARGGQCSRECRAGFLNATKGEFWFVHKPTSQLSQLYAKWYQCPRTVLANTTL
eukprot:scaffold9809_cov60-Phaeocystis_antarctica.AAC.5